MSRTTFYKPALIAFLLLVCSILSVPAEVFAAPADTTTTALTLSAEELAYRDRAGEIIIGCPVENCPVLFQDKKTGQPKGITIDILDMIAEATGLTFRYLTLPSGAITYDTLNQLQIDVIAGSESNEINAHSPGMAMTSAYMHSEKVFVCKKGMIFQPDSAMTIAVSSGSQTLAKIIQKQYPSFQVLFCDSPEEALAKLLSGKADAVLQNQYTADRILCKPIYENLQIVAAASVGDSQCLACLIPVSEGQSNELSEDDALLLSILNKGIASLDQSKVSFLIIRETAENAYQFTMWDMMYRYRFAGLIVLISLLMILFLLRRNRLLLRKRSEQLAAEQRAKELAAINARMKEQQLLLMDSLKRAEEGNRAKTTFLFNMSHDIRTPMNAILGFTELAARNKNDMARLSDCLEKIQASGKHLLQLINNVLDMSEIESGTVTLTEDCCNLEECMEKVRETLQLEIDKKQLNFHADLSAVKNKWVYCDVLRFHQILFNLLNNAVKFSRTGGKILIALSEKPCAIQNYAAYEIRVKDHGVGMSQEFLTHIFEPFEREHTSTISQIPGTGLGMSITKNLVDLMGGTIQVSSRPGQGTEFVLQFTFKLREQESTSAADSPASTTDFSGRRLLLVEDNELNMEIAEELLLDAGFLIETAQNGQIAVDMVQDSSEGYYDAILMDIQMPVMNGYQASRAIRSLADRRLAAIPIIALTANAFDEDKKEALANGMNAHIAKPLDLDVLYDTLRAILEGR